MIRSVVGNGWDPLGLLYLVASLATFSFGAGLILYERGTRASRKFFLLTAIAAAWLAALGLSLMASAPASTVWLRAAFVFDPLTAPALYLVATELLRVHRPARVWGAWLAGGVFSLASLLGPAVVEGLATLTRQHTLMGGGWLGALYVGYVTGVAVAALATLAEGGRTAPTEEDGRELRLLGLAAAVGSLNLVDFWTSTEPFRTGLITPLAVLAGLGLVAVVATRYRVFARIQSFGTHEVLRSMSDAVLVCDREGRVRAVNPAAARLLERAAERLEGVPVSVLLARRGERERPWVLCANTAQRNLDMDLLAPSGPVAVRVSTEPLQSRGHTVGAVVVARDVRDRLADERALEAAQLRYRALYHHNPGLVHEFDTRGRVVGMNPALRRLLGLAPEQDLSAAHWSDFVVPEDAPLIETLFEAVMRGASREYEVRLMGPGGEARPVHGVVVPVRDGDQIVGIFGVGLDMTEARRVRHELEVQRRYFADLFETSPEAIVLLGADGRVLRINGEFTRMFGYTVEEAVGSQLNDLIVPDHLEWEGRELQDGTHRGRLVRAETVRRRKDGSLVDVSLLARDLVIPGEPKQLYGIYRDISERRETERRLREREEELRHAQKLEAVGKLAGGIAHDFNNLLTVINGHARFALERMEPGCRVGQDLWEIEKAGERAARLTHQLLAYSRRQVLRPQVLDPNAVLTELRGMLDRTLGVHVRVATRLEAEGRVRADRGQLDQVLMNLVLNSRDAMPDGGTITLATDRITLAAGDERAARWEVAPGDYVRIRVADNGTGMDADTLERAFEPFFTTKAPGKGTGLGLATVFGIVKQSDGHVVIESAPGEGTTCDIILPAAPGSGPVEPIPSATTHGEEPVSGTILVVEDEEAVRKLAVRVLERQGCTVLSAHDGEAALAVLAGRDGPLDLVLTDLVMPRMGGRELAERLRAERPGLPVILMSGYDEELTSDDSAPGFTFLAKPFTPQELTGRVASFLRPEHA